LKTLHVVIGNSGEMEMKDWFRLCKLAGIIPIAISVQFQLFAQAAPAKAHPQKPATRVPFVGCKSDGQVGPLDAPKSKSQAVEISPALSQRLAYYEAENGPGVLAPRGWYCFSTYGSNGSNLFVSPEPILAANLFSTDWKGFSGPVIQLSDEAGDTSGRFGVARTIARVFPAHRDFVENAIAEGIEPASSFPFGPYPDDKLTYRSKEVVEFQTPANKVGLGTASRLQANDAAISGVAILVGKELDLLQLSIRLSPQLNDLRPAIIHETVQEAKHLNP
jgi:hypothetical protein